MALDAQSNWDVEMPQLRLGATGTEEKLPSMSPSQPALVATSTPGKEIELPLEVLIQIVSYIPRRQQYQKTLWACCLVSRAWYSAAVMLLYERPHIGGGNFQEFVATICPSKNAHIRKSQLAGMVKNLDMGSLVHDGSKSLTARLLGRLKGSLEEFVAPQASFSINSFAALAKCKNLKFLNLSLMSASISIRVLFQTLKSLDKLETLFFPRTSNQDEGRESPYDWPPKLQALHIAGGVDDYFLRVHATNIPSSVERISIQHCSQIYTEALQEFLLTVGPQLRHLTLRHPLIKLPPGVLNGVLQWCPNLVALRISVDYVSDALLESNGVKCHPLRVLELDCSNSADAEVGISPDSIWLAIDNGYLPDLRSIIVNARLAWQATERLRTSVSDLVELVQERERKNPLKLTPGVWSVVS
ncbi:hypothetical protein V499_09582 [Pseudogymnoascus sp. VKM F-103]|uniref:F-box domain-containing protein n=1 Tax=Pseudogymnoascus verrucosus TaxID=342668 RepID=A0A1B8GU21_9PEZI|nr:uncharacterized protein VE01_02692 [Pseudogymnoascus verrucosus]KFY69969.1 hypothetical protein V499_09582 [Pseudogymnoascus sp. VKM F-103]OBT99326.1 hypothetical protein VE01_02692 [Pseudogymnoascus verrucosus]